MLFWAKRQDRIQGIRRADQSWNAEVWNARSVVQAW